MIRLFHWSSNHETLDIAQRRRGLVVPWCYSTSGVGQSFGFSRVGVGLEDLFYVRVWSRTSSVQQRVC